MKLKRFAKVLVACVTAATLFTGCGGSSSGGDKTDNNFSGKDVQLGVLTNMNTTETQLGEHYNKLVDHAGLKDADKFRPKFYENLRTMQMAVESGNVTQISLYKCVADYLVANNDKFEVVPNEAINKIQDAFCFAVRKDDTQLKADLDRVIDEMKADGSLDKLIDDYITKVSAGKVAPPSVEIPVTEGAPTIKVGVTGDLPPLDLVTADGKAAGFNTALLAEISKRLGRNIQIVDIDTGARAAALSSKLIDVVFWAIMPLGSQFPSDIDKPEGLELSAPYFKDSIAHIRLKDAK